jgi:hypothetical protein
MLKGLFVALALVTSTAVAQQWEVGAIGGYGYTTSATVSSPAGSANAGFNKGASFGAFAGNDTNEHWSGEVRYLYGYSDLNLSSGSTSVNFAGHSQIISGAILAHLRRRDARVRPFVAVGGGIKFVNGTGTESASQPLGNIAALTHTQNFYPIADVGIGVKLNLAKNMRVRVEVHDFISPPPTKVITPAPGGSFDGWVNDIQALVSISYAFGSER